MDNNKNNKPDQEIVNDLKAVHKSAEKDPNKKYHADDLKPAIDGLSEQLKGSDADSDKSLGENLDETAKQKQSKGSDAASA